MNISSHIVDTFNMFKLTVMVSPKSKKTDIFESKNFPEKLNCIEQMAKIENKKYLVSNQICLCDLEIFVWYQTWKLWKPSVFEPFENLKRVVKEFDKLPMTKNYHVFFKNVSQEWLAQN